MEYVCPICFSSHNLQALAINCFTDCVRRADEDEVYEETKYQCPICNDSFSNEASAEECYFDCYTNRLENEPFSFLCCTCQNQDLKLQRFLPCPNKFGEGVEYCSAYDPDVRTFGCAIETNYRYKVMLNGGAV